MVRKDVQAEFESAVSQIQHQPGAVGHAEKSFVIKMRGLIRQEDKLVRKSDINKLCHKAIEKVVEPMVSQKVLAAQRLNSERPGGFPPASATLSAGGPVQDLAGLVEGEASTSRSWWWYTLQPERAVCPSVFRVRRQPLSA